MRPYTHTQRLGPFAIALYGGVGLMSIVGAAYAPHEGRIISAVMLAVVVVCAVLFSSLTTMVDNTTFRWYFGPRAISKSVRLDDVATAEATRTTFWNGWGIHLTRNGWLYNIAGFRAVKVTLRSGKQFLVGTDDPEGLCAAIVRGRSAQNSGQTPH